MTGSIARPESGALDTGMHRTAERDNRNGIWDFQAPWCVPLAFRGRNFEVECICLPIRLRGPNKHGPRLKEGSRQQSIFLEPIDMVNAVEYIARQL